MLLILSKCKPLSHQPYLSIIPPTTPESSIPSISPDSNTKRLVDCLLSSYLSHPYEPLRQITAKALSRLLDTGIIIPLILDQLSFILHDLTVIEDWNTIHGKLLFFYELILLITSNTTINQSNTDSQSHFLDTLLTSSTLWSYLTSINDFFITKINHRYLHFPLPSVVLGVWHRILKVLQHLIISDWKNDPSRIQVLQQLSASFQQQLLRYFFPRLNSALSITDSSAPATHTTRFSLISIFSILKQQLQRDPGLSAVLMEVIIDLFQEKSLDSDQSQLVPITTILSYMINHHQIIPDDYQRGVLLGIQHLDHHTDGRISIFVRLNFICDWIILRSGLTTESGSHDQFMKEDSTLCQQLALSLLGSLSIAWISSLSSFLSKTETVIIDKLLVIGSKLLFKESSLNGFRIEIGDQQDQQQIIANHICKDPILIASQLTPEIVIVTTAIFTIVLKLLPSYSNDDQRLRYFVNWSNVYLHSILLPGWHETASVSVRTALSNSLTTSQLLVCWWREHLQSFMDHPLPIDIQSSLDHILGHLIVISSSSVYDDDADLRKINTNLLIGIIDVLQSHFFQEYQSKEEVTDFHLPKTAVRNNA
jgi:hypothetical protein